MQNSGTVPCRNEGCVFLSHTGQDSTKTGSIIAERMRSELKHIGKKAFFDAITLQVGENNTAILDAVRACSVFVAIITPAYIQRKWPLKESHEALKSRREILTASTSPMRISRSGHGDLKKRGRGTANLCVS
jgi:hypothetical protein